MRATFLDVQRACEVAEHEVALPVRDVVERHGAEGLDERDPDRRVELVLDPAVDDAHVSRAELLRLGADRHRHRALQDEHHLLGVLVAVSRDGRPWLVRDTAQEDLVAGDRLEPDPFEHGVGRTAVEAGERRVRH